MLNTKHKGKHNKTKQIAKITQRSQKQA